MKNICDILFKKKQYLSYMESLPLKNNLDGHNSENMKNLLEDIKNYYFTKKIVQTIYSNSYHHLINDLELFFNNFKSTNGYNNEYLMKYRRMFTLKHKTNNILKSIINEIGNLNNFHKEINIKLGILIPDERRDFLNYMKFKCSRNPRKILPLQELIFGASGLNNIDYSENIIDIWSNFTYS